MASHSARVTHTVTMNLDELKYATGIPKSARVTNVETLKFGDNPIHAIRVTVETKPRWTFHRLLGKRG